MNQAACILSILLILSITLASVSAQSVINHAVEHSMQTGTSRDLGIVPQLERKDTRMLCLEGCPLNGPDAWDIPHENRGSHDSDRCIKAAVSMVNSYYGGHLSQDRIAYYVYHEVLGYESPQNDLGHGEGILGYSTTIILSWALNNASTLRTTGKPGFEEIAYWIDHNIPIIRDHGEYHWITVIDGYDTEGQMIHVIDPLTATESNIPYDSLDVFVAWIPAASNITARSDEPTLWMDSDGDGVIDFDETNRFHTAPYDNDTYNLGIDDKSVIKYTYIDHLTFPTANFKWSPQTPQINQQVLFNASQCAGNLTLFRWDFGDGNIAGVTEPTVYHSYDELGIYDVTLTVFDSNGLWNITTSSIAIRFNLSGTEFEHPFYRQSTDRKGFAPTDGPYTPNILWTSFLNGSVTTSPAVAHGMVFVGTSNGLFYALDLITGGVSWTFNAGSSVTSSPAVQEGVVFFGTNEPGRIFAIYADTGFVKWSHQVSTGAAVSSSPAVSDGRVIVGCSDGSLFCLNQWDGHVLWNKRLSASSLTSPAIQGGAIFITSGEGVHAVDVLTGTQIWENETSWPVISCPAAADGLVFVGAENDDRVYAFNQTTGNQVWSFWRGGWFTAAAVDSSKQLVIVGCKDLRLYCLDERTGKLRWEFINGPNHLSAPTISANGLVYAGSTDGNLYCVEEDTGKMVWSYSFTTPIISSPSVIYEHVLIGTMDGELYCFGPPFPSEQVPIHNVAVANLSIASFEIEKGSSLEVNVTVENEGEAVETFGLVLYANGTMIETKDMVLMNGSSIITTFVWNTSGFSCGSYNMSAYATPLPEETNITDNTLFGGWVVVSTSADLNGDFTVDIYDAIVLSGAYNSSPADPNWNPSADINNDDFVDIFDAIVLASHYGETYD